MGRRPRGASPAPASGPALQAIQAAPLLKDRAYEVLREAILRLDLRPGEPLTERVLAERLGVSKSPIRDGLIRLEQEGLVRSTPFKGFEVAGLTPDDMHAVFEFREAMELYCVEAFVRRASDARLSELEATQAHQRRLMEANEWLRAYEESRFHQTLVESLENPVFLAAARVVQAQLRRIQNLASTIPGRLAKTHAEHEAVLQGIRARDVAAAQEAMHVHIRSVLEDTLRSSELRRITSEGTG